MGTRRGSNGDGWPPDGGGQPEDLPELPPEWGTIVIPDDPAELAEEAAAVRRELRRDARRVHWRRRFGLSDAGPSDTPSLGLPLLIMSIAVLATLTSLFAVAWPGPGHPIAGPSQVQRTAASMPAGRSTLPALDLLDTAGRSVSLRGLLPAAIVLTDGCACADLVTATLAAAPAAVTVVTVTTVVPSAGRRGPAPTAGAPLGQGGVRALADPTDELRKALSLGPATGSAAVVLVTRDAVVAKSVPAARSVEEYRSELLTLAG